MKFLLNIQSGGSAAARSIHKAAYGRTQHSKPGAHRYERRKIREHLKHADSFEDNFIVGR
ncbi:MAG: hypothetical protein H7Y43_14580 [Akkermansiaceae bacterium]|nr:hypothetical protein [Verrucomicrobiales bacterium]